MFSAVWLHSSFSITSWLSRQPRHALRERHRAFLQLVVGDGLEDQADLAPPRAPGSRRR